MEEILAPGRCCSSEWWFTTSAWSSNVSVNFCWTVSSCTYMIFQISVPFLSLIPFSSFSPNAIASKFSPLISHPFSLRVYVPSCSFLSLFCFPPLEVKFLYQCFGTCSSDLCLVDVLPLKWVDLKPFIVISHGSVGWLGSAGHFSLGSLMQLKSDVGWSHSHRSFWLSRLPKMAHSGCWQLMQAVGWEFNWSVSEAPTHDPSMWFGYLQPNAGFWERARQEQISQMADYWSSLKVVPRNDTVSCLLVFY